MANPPISLFSRCAAVSLAAVILLSTGAFAALPPCSLQAEKLWWETHPDPAGWFAAGDELEKTLVAGEAEIGLKNLGTHADFAGWMLHLRWLRLFPKTWREHEYYKNPPSWKTFAALGMNHAVRDLFLGSLAPEDDPVAAARILCAIAEANPDGLRDYSRLAVAFAVVLDQPPPAAWPHPFVDQKKIPFGDSDPVKRFAFYVECHRAGRLLHDPRHLGVRDLTWMVDSFVELRELGYAQQVKLKQADRLARLFASLKYDMHRIQGKLYQWQGATYRLIDIGKGGGICMDLGYFVWQTGKSQGIPTILFTGQGLSGDHAWVGFLTAAGKWDFDLARIRQEKYPVGFTYDPQTWLSVTNAEVAAELEGVAANRGFGPADVFVQWAALSSGRAVYPELLRLARAARTRDVRIWRTEAEWLARSDVPPAERYTFWEAWTRAFFASAPLKIQGQLKMLAVLEEMGKQADADRLRAQLTRENQSDRFDVSVSVVAQPILENLRRRDWERAEAGFLKAMDQLASSAGGHLFYSLVQPYVAACIKEGRMEMARRARPALEHGFRAKPGTILHNDIDELKALIQ